MSKKPEFDLVLLSGLGHRDFAVPKDAAMAIFNLFAGHDIYEVTSEWLGGDVGSIQIAKLISSDQNPTIRTLGPAQFHQALENHRAREEEKKAKKKARENA